MKQPIIGKSELSDTYYVMTDYEDKGKGHYIAKRKFDVTSQMKFWIQSEINERELCCKRGKRKMCKPKGEKMKTGKKCFYCEEKAIFWCGYYYAKNGNVICGWCSDYCYQKALEGARKGE